MYKVRLACTPFTGVCIADTTILPCYTYVHRLTEGCTHRLTYTDRDILTHARTDTHKYMHTY